MCRPGESLPVVHICSVLRKMNGHKGSGTNKSSQQEDLEPVSQVKVNYITHANLLSKESKTCQIILVTPILDNKIR